MPRKAESVRVVCDFNDETLVFGIERWTVGELHNQLVTAAFREDITLWFSSFDP